MGKLRKPTGITFELELTELGKTVKYRPFKLKEQKKLLLASGLKDKAVMTNALLDIVEQCTFGELNVRKLPMHITDYLFTKIYIKSVGNMSQAQFECAGEVIEKDDEGHDHKVPCGVKLNLNLDLERATLVYPDTYRPNETIELEDGMFVRLRVPTFEEQQKIDFSKSLTDVTDQFIVSLIEAIVDGEEMQIPGQDVTPDEVVEWLDELSASSIEKITGFLQNLPQLTMDVNVTCPKCGRKEEFKLTGLEDFFG
ncbi:baseplate hub assembly chaperone [Stenotrophomonas phage YB07]|uniref:Baseplate hub assembly chaperone n=1 Tax=Stenotrophomonas phage YB07 TaxID=2555548 RepID=A0A482IHB5_9CAUD|nr:baseplate hub assembly chaperone [Stenotrophomonas phage YB07]QBP06255.1 baseplate hub assembly chaperone [Stenotrophomonas phage YB07]QYW02601.1 baseplate hub protein [Stenotrophomonas phage Marzo]